MRRQQKSAVALFVAVILGATLTPLAAQSAAPAPALNATAKMETLLRESPLHWTKTRDTEWATSFKGTEAPTVTVYVSLVDDLVVVQSAIAKPALSQTQLTDLLSLNFSLDLVKVSLQDDELIALNETEVRLLDGPGLERIVENVARCADDVAGTLAGATASDPAAPPVLRRPSSSPALSPVTLEARAR